MVWPRPLLETLTILPLAKFVLKNQLSGLSHSIDSSTNVAKTAHCKELNDLDSPAHHVPMPTKLNQGPLSAETDSFYCFWRLHVMSAGLGQ